MSKQQRISSSPKRRLDGAEEKWKSIFGGRWNELRAWVESGWREEQQSESANSCLSDRWKEGGREEGKERVRQRTTGGDKADEERTSSKTS